MLQVKPNNSDGDELPSEGSLNSFVSFITMFLGQIFVSFVLRYNLPLDKEGIYLKITKLDNNHHSVTCTKSNE
ncbi:hypothetical protein CN676_28705 [Bacillus wiedmannii]|nr:hypothetical protein CON96_07890 [Bacillus wiedmannii]PEI81515.1 hypothetical protein CN905_00170 [Bacillus wiedmannii]PEJ42932.1 hypothetical protein CN676_28705 [Bacillus wiedmannii]PEO74491.1 hypothetical protein CN572_05520 [Bacillus wiedmannii]PGA32627.1 hypothetical protein COL74_16255 [Bacillus wiedmannii]